MRSEHGIYILRRTDNQARKAVLEWVDDIILFDDDDSDIECSFKQRFIMKTLDDLDYFVRMKIERSGSGSLYINHARYIEKVLERFKIESSKPLATPMEKKILRKTHLDELVANQLEYKDTFGSL